MGYTINIVGEQHYQPAVSSCEEGQVVTIAHEIGNPHDEHALVILNAESGERLGYVPRESFLRRVIFHENRLVEAEIYTIFDRKGFLEVNLHVDIVDDDNSEGVAQVPYVAPWKPTQPPVTEDDPEDEPDGNSILYGVVGSVLLAALILLIFLR